MEVATEMARQQANSELKAKISSQASRKYVNKFLTFTLFMGMAAIFVWQTRTLVEKFLKGQVKYLEMLLR